MADAELVITQGSAKAIEIKIVDANGAPGDISGVGAATFVVRESVGSASAILDRRTSTSTLEVMKGISALRATLSQTEADNLKPGLFLGEVAVEISGTWVHSERFWVRILDSMAPHA